MVNDEWWINSYFAHRGHEIRVSIPSRNNVPMEVNRNACAASTTDIDANIKALRVERGFKPRDRLCDQLIDFQQFVIGHAGQVVGLPVRCDHKMPTGVRIGIEQNEGGRSTVHNKVLTVLVRIR